MACQPALQQSPVTASPLGAWLLGGCGRSVDKRPALAQVQPPLSRCTHDRTFTTVGATAMSARALALFVSGLLAVTGVGLPAAAASETALIHVAVGSATASDSNPGTYDRPLKTLVAGIKAAEASTARGINALVKVHPGVYRESVSIGASSTAATLAIEAAAAGVVVSGADISRGWEQQPDGTWRQDWPHNWGLAPLPSGWPAVDPLLRRRELVVVDGRLLRQVSAYENLRSEPGTFLVDEATDSLLVKPEVGLDLATATIEVATRPTALSANHRHGLSVRGLTFRHVATPFQRGGVVINGARNLTIEDSRFEFNSWSGLTLFYVDGADLRRNRINDNGVLGIQAWRNRDMMLDSNETSRNNTTRGAWAKYSGWEVGSKILHTHGLTMLRHTAEENNGPGMWLDSDVTNVLVEDSLFARNVGFGFYHEKNQGPSMFRRNRICGNGSVGFMNDKSSDTTLERNHIFDNRAEAVAMSGPSGTYNVVDWETNQSVPLRNERFTLVDNVISQGAARLVKNNLQLDDWQHLKGTLHSERNQWHSTHSAPFTVPGKWLTFAGWRSDTQQESSSTYVQPSGLSCAHPAPTDPVAIVSPTPTPTPAPAPAPAPTTSPVPTVEQPLAPVTYEYAASLSGRHLRRDYKIEAVAGVHKAKVVLSRGSSVTLQIHDASGRRLASATGGSGLSISGDYAAGHFSYSVSGAKGTTFALMLTAPPP